MLSDKGLYFNVNEGLESARSSIKEIYCRKDLRMIMEALLIDNTVPMQLFVDLFDIHHDDVEEYRNYFFNIPKNVPRIYLLDYINNIEDPVRKTFFMGVFYEGWSFMDIKLNNGRRSDLTAIGRLAYLNAVSHANGKISEYYEQSKREKTDTLTPIKGYLAIIKEAVKLFPNKEDNASASEQIIFNFLSTIKEKSSTVNEVSIEGLAMDDEGLIDTGSVSEDYASISKDVEELKKK